MDTGVRIKFLEEVIEPLYSRLADCDICPRNCRVNRLKGDRGYCGSGKDLVVYTAFLHQGEEPTISEKKGSGTIFFSGCNLKCVFCQNSRFSHAMEGRAITEEELAVIMLKLQEKGAVNINLVTPTHFLPQILKASMIAYKRGLDLPVVYNTSGYEKKEIISFAGKAIDVYLTDMKYIDPLLAEKYSGAGDYPVCNQEAIREMYMQKKTRIEDNVMKEGVIIRHLSLPNHSLDSMRVLSWIKENTPEANVSMMFQYQPYSGASFYKEINRRVNRPEYEKITAFLEGTGLQGWIQDYRANEELAGIFFPSSLENFL